MFQAIRIAVNHELESLERALPAAWALLRPGGRMAAISFHSLEDRMVKRFLVDRARGCICPPDLPVCGCGREPEAELINRRAVRPSAGEVAGNPRAAVGAPARGAEACARPAGKAPPPRRRKSRARADDSSHEGTTAPADERGPQRGGDTLCDAAHAGSPDRPAPSPGVRTGPAPRATAQAATARAIATPLPVPPLGAISLRVLRAGRSLQDSTLLERLVRGRGWIMLLGTLLFGLVALNVSLLKLNAAAGHNAERAKVLRIQNAKLRGKVSRLASGDRLRAAAGEMGLVMPEPKKMHYLSARPDRDPGQAVRNIRDGTALSLTDDLVSATPEIDSEVLAPTPPEPIVETPEPAPVAQTTDPAADAPPRRDRRPRPLPQEARRCRSAARHARGLAASVPRRVAAAVQPCVSQLPG